MDAKQQVMDFHSPVIFLGILNVSSLSRGQPPAALSFTATSVVSEL